MAQKALAVAVFGPRSPVAGRDMGVRDGVPLLLGPSGMFPPAGGLPYARRSLFSARRALSRVITRVATTVRISRELKATAVTMMLSSP
ncbi:hypothetical protein OHB54_04350 [Streptomyces sp. NBC_01007]|nr:hypothetical protein OHB54_04350 [Streptomyces sp. NBC_01007]